MFRKTIPQLKRISSLSYPELLEVATNMDEVLDFSIDSDIKDMSAKELRTLIDKYAPEYINIYWSYISEYYD